MIERQECHLLNADRVDICNSAGEVVYNIKGRIFKVLPVFKEGDGDSLSIALLRMILEESDTA